tara:strand:+ start:409 stop:2094 length:1686 start_codon:yes stop_codon:yes gene_type:complete
MRKKPLPLGTSDFKSLIEQNNYYVDKTGIIAELLQGSAVTLLPRPRRFGKTLNMSMLKYFFSNAEDYHHLFDGLAVTRDSETMAHCGQYPVIFLSFKDVKESQIADVFKRISQLIKDIYIAHSYLTDDMDADDLAYFQRVKQGSSDSVELADSVKKLSQFLHHYHKKPAVIIIDEYDMPINSGFTHGYYDELVGFLRNLLSGAFKDNPSLFKGVMTGILRIARESIFSGLNNIDVCTLTSSRFNQYFGFTEDETEQLLQDYGLSYELDAVKCWYNGYNFGEATIYNPWSIISLILHQGELSPYWLNTSDNAIVRDLIAKAPYELKQELEALLSDDNAAVRKPLNEHVVFRDIGRSSETIWNFLLFTGYLRYQDKRLGASGETTISLSIPNREVGYFYTSAILGWFDTGIDSRTIALPSILGYLLRGDFDSFSKAFIRFCSETFSYFDVQGKQPERFYHAFVLGMLVQLKESHTIKSNRESGYGRYDVCVIPHDKSKAGFVFEFRSIDEYDQFSLEQACDQALAQIESKHYVAELEALGVESVYPVAMAFEGKKVLVRFGEI